MTTYTAIVQEQNKDLTWLINNKYNLAVAKGIASTVSGDPEFNVIFSSNTIGTLANNMAVSWQETYGLNWCRDVPAPGAKVTYSGTWTQCDIDKGLVLGDGGIFSIGTGQKGGLSVQNNYMNACILVGVKDQTTNSWNTVCLTRSDVSERQLKSNFMTDLSQRRPIGQGRKRVPCANRIRSDMVR